jgi:hypothetical protein
LSLTQPEGLKSSSLIKLKPLALRFVMRSLLNWVSSKKRWDPGCLIEFVKARIQAAVSNTGLQKTWKLLLMSCRIRRTSPVWIRACQFASILTAPAGPRLHRVVTLHSGSASGSLGEADPWT